MFMNEERSQGAIGDNIADGDTGDNILRAMLKYNSLDEANAFPGEINGDTPSDLDSSGENVSGENHDDISGENSDEMPEDETDKKLNVAVPALGNPQDILLPKAPEQWVKSFNITYGSKIPYKVVNVEGNDLHFKLRCLENHERESRDFSGKIPNYVVANIGFVISDRVHEKGGHHGRRFVSFPIKFGDQSFTQVNDTYHFDEKADDGETPRSSEFKEELIAESSADKKSAIERDYTSSGPNFVQSYHHSERALWKSLKKSETVDPIFQELGKVLPTGGKVYCMVFDLHSTRYMCSYCEPSSFIVQQKLKAKFEDRFAGKYKISGKGLFSFSRVSAEEKKKRSQKNDSDHREKCTETVQELRDKNLSVVFQRDDRSTKSYKKIMEAHGFFVSTDTERLNPPKPFYVSQRMDVHTQDVAVTRQNSSFGKFTKDDTKKIKALIKKIDTLRNARKFEDALACLEEALQIEPENFQAINRYSLVLLGAERFIEALPWAQKAHAKSVEINPAGEDVENCRGVLKAVRYGLLPHIKNLIRTENWHDAQNLAEELFHIDDKCEELYFLYVDSLIPQGLADVAVETLDTFLQDVQFSEGWKNKALAVRKTILKQMAEVKTDARDSGLQLRGGLGL